MRSHSFSKQFNGSMEVENPKQQDETHLSGAYIRSLVKQLSSSRSKDNNPPSAKTALEDANDGELHQTQQQQQQQRPPGSPKSRPQKKQVRRRLHTTRPYQERLFNMAEARREIVAALKLHRAAMKQANNQPHEQKQQEQTMASASTLQLTSLELVDSTGNNSFNHLPNYNLSSFFHGSTPFPPTTFPSPNKLPSTCPPVTPFSMYDHLNFHLPDHPLGLNLNLQSFQNIDTSIYCNQTLHEPSSPPASSLSCSNSSPKAISGVASSSQQTPQAPVHLAMDDEEMAEIQSIGEQHDIEWNDKMNSATSAWWSKFLKSMEGGLESDELRVSDQFLGSPSWLNDGVGATAKESNSLMHQHLDEYFRVEDYLESFDTGEIEYQEGGEWLP